MAEDQENKTEPATAKRRQQASEGGHNARSQDLTSAFMLFAGIIVISFVGQRVVSECAGIMKALLSETDWPDKTQILDACIRTVAKPIVSIMWPIFAVMAGASFFITVIQVGFKFNPAVLTPNFVKLNPLGGLRRLMGGQNWFQLAMNIVKLIIISSIAYSQFKDKLPLMLQLWDYEFPANMKLGMDIVFSIAWRLSAALLILALLDWMYHKWKFERDIRMTKQEVKDEAKSMEGDQAFKGRRLQMARKMLFQRIQANVPRADVIVTNPTELAIAIRYDPETMRAPRVVAKGADYLAMRIRQIAVQHAVPIVERKPLAQAMYKSVEIGQEVPPQFYQAIAEILAYVYELNGKGRALKKSA